jgi:hypothetical protein
MAVDVCTPVQLSKNAGVDVKCATVAVAINAANTVTIDLGNVAWEKAIIHIKNTEGSTNVVTFSAGTGMSMAQGALASGTIAATTGEQAFVLESSRLKNMSTGLLTLSFEAGMTGFVACYLLP